MQVGSLVQTVGDFTEVRKDWGHLVEYPNKGDILTVISVSPHLHKNMRRIGAVMLVFEELNNKLGIFAF